MEGQSFLLTAALLVFATPVMSFMNDTQLNFTIAGCGTTKLCVEFPNGCDPAVNQSCLFASVFAPQKASNSTMLTIMLTGQSSGFITLALNTSQGIIVTFSCGQNSSANGTTFFNATQMSLTVTDYKVLVNANLIQCALNLSVSNTIFSILLENGLANNTNLNNSFSVSLTNGPTSVTNPTNTTAPTAVSNSTNATSPTTISNMTTMKTTPTTTKATGASSALHPYALLVLLSILTLSILQKA